ncbi:MAG: ribbon-helix-helix domain-containing protein [Coleofasciculaceae cyanobacterium]
MAVDKSKKVQVKVSMPKELHQQLKDISEATGIPMSTMMLQATIEKYLGDSEALLRSTDRSRE